MGLPVAVLLLEAVILAVAGGRPILGLSVIQLARSDRLVAILVLRPASVTFMEESGLVSMLEECLTWIQVRVFQILG